MKTKSKKSRRCESARVLTPQSRPQPKNSTEQRHCQFFNLDINNWNKYKLNVLKSKNNRCKPKEVKPKIKCKLCLIYIKENSLEEHQKTEKHKSKVIIRKMNSWIGMIRESVLQSENSPKNYVSNLWNTTNCIL